MPINIFAVGDIMLGEQPLCENFGVKSIIQEIGSDFLFSEVSPLLNEGDIVFGNLECSIAINNPTQYQQPMFFCISDDIGDIAQALRRAGFTALSVANNHIMENGRECFLDTIDSLRQHNITPIGIIGEIPILNVEGKSIAFLAYSFIEDGVINCSYNKIRSEEQILNDVKKIRSKADLIVVSLHWGSEFVPYPSPEQALMGRTLIDAGVDIILGGHPHVNQGYEMYKNRPIIYSLGNFIFDQTYIVTTQESAIVKITIDDDMDSFDVRIIPIHIDKSYFFPQVTGPSEGEKIMDAFEKIRKILEGRTISEYREILGDYHVLSQGYKRSAHSCMKKQFIQKWYRYSLTTTIDIVRKFVSKGGEQG